MGNTRRSTYLHDSWAKLYSERKSDYYIPSFPGNIALRVLCKIEGGAKVRFLLIIYYHLQSTVSKDSLSAFYSHKFLHIILTMEEKS